MNLNSISLATLVALTGLTSSCSATGPVVARELTGGEAIESQIYTFESGASGFNTKTYFYDNGEEVVAIDAQFTPELAKKALDFLRTKTSSPVTYLIITHPNPDKFNGMKVFQEAGAKVIASQKTAENMPVAHQYKKHFFVNVAGMFTEENYPKLAKPDLIFVDQYDLQLGNGDVITLTELNQSGVSTNQTVAYIEEQKALFVGDLIHHNAHAWLEGGIVNGSPAPNVQSWINILQNLSEQFSNTDVTVYGGRGEATRLNEAISQQTQYLQVAEEIVSDYVSRHLNLKAELLGPKAAAHFTALQKEFEKAYPRYSLGYLIQYGVYGLVNSKL